uniref:Uncharacterized protein n=1 Tax=Percolomonas cosmopolitus TaxID=63605 RepID=A0A7S1KQT8_9EUKA
MPSLSLNSIREYVHKHEYINILWKNAPFRYLFISGIISRIGDFLTFIAISSRLEEETQNSQYNGLTLSLLVVSLVLPQVVFSPWAGVLADLMDKRIVMLISDLFRACIVLLFLVTENSTILVLLVLFACEVFASFFNPSREGLIPFVVPEKDLDVANAMDALMWMSCSFLGSTFGGITMLVAGSTMCYILDSITYLISAVCVVLLIFAMRRSDRENQDGLELLEDAPEIEDIVLIDSAEDVETKEEPNVDALEPDASNDGANNDNTHMQMEVVQPQLIEVATPPDSSLLSDIPLSDVDLELPIEEKPMMEMTRMGGAKFYLRKIPTEFMNQITAHIYGVVFLATNPFLLTVALAKAFQSSIWGTLDIVIIIFSSGRYRMLDNPAVFMSVVRACMGLTSGVSPVLLERIVKPTSALAMRRTLSFSHLLMSLGMLITFLATFFGYYVGIVFFIGGAATLAYGGGMVWVYSTIILQKNSPENYVGRIMSFDMGFAAGAIECGSAVLVGFLIDFTSVSMDIIIAILMGFTLMVTIFWLIHYAHFKKLPEQYEPTWLFNSMRYSGLSADRKQEMHRDLQAQKGIIMENWTANPELDHIAKSIIDRHQGTKVEVDSDPDVSADEFVEETA